MDTNQRPTSFIDRGSTRIYGIFAQVFDIQLGLRFSHGTNSSSPRKRRMVSGVGTLCDKKRPFYSLAKRVGTAPLRSVNILDI